MEKLKGKHTIFLQALDTLKSAIDKFEALTEEDYYYTEVRDSVIKRFTYTMDVFWKLVKEYLNNIYGLDPISSPKAIFRACFDIKIISNEEYELCIKLIDDRNLSSHSYNEILAKEIVEAAVAYYSLMRTVIDRISQKLI